MKYKCSQCEYWVNQQCRIKSPVVITDGYEPNAVGILTVWPETKADDGCGEIKLKQ